MKKFLFKIVGFLLVILLIGHVISLLSLYFLNQSSLYKPQFIKNAISDKNFDYVILGSSTGLTTLNTNLIDEKLRANGLNISMDDSALSTHYLMLQYFFHQKKSTKYLILAFTPWDLANKNPKINSNDYRFLSEYKLKFVRDYYQNMPYIDFPVLKYATYFPLFGVSYYNTELFYPSIFTIINPNKRNRFDEKGNYSYPDNGILRNKDSSTITVKTKNPYFYKIKDFCKKNDIVLILYQSPIYKTSILFETDEHFINHNNFLKNESMFYDNIHVNSIGRELCTSDFVEQFLEIKYNKF